MVNLFLFATHTHGILYSAVDSFLTVRIAHGVQHFTALNLMCIHMENITLLVA